MLHLTVHHVAVICSDYHRSKDFYVGLLGFPVIRETWRADRQSWKLDLQAGNVQIELFSFPDPPERLTHPEARGLRHLAFAVDDVQVTSEHLAQAGIETEPIRMDEQTGKRFTFFRDPDNLPLELYEKEPGMEKH